MYVTRTILDRVEARYGVPKVISLKYEISPWEIAVVRGSRKDGRSHDVTLFIFKGHQLALIQKYSYPLDGFRAPSGGLKPGEPLEVGAKREAYEETGLEIELESYLLRIEATFTCEQQVEPPMGSGEPWTTHIFLARAVGGELANNDPKEIKAVRWGTVQELQGPIRQTLLDTGRGLFRYRVALTDATIDMLKDMGHPVVSGLQEA